MPTRLCQIVAAALSVSSLPVWAAPSGDGPESVDAGQLVQVTLGLAAVLVVIIALAWFVKRVLRYSGVANGALQAVGGLSLGPREKVVLLQVGETQILLGVSPGRVQTLHVLDQPVDVTPYKESTAPFAERLRKAVHQGREG